MRSISYLLLIALVFLTSCALNKLFLVPYPLHTEDTFTRYIEEFEDSLTMTFNDRKEPVVHHSDGKLVDFSYDFKSDFFENDRGDSIQYWLLKPDNYNGVTIYFLHGNAGNLVYQFGLMKPLALSGFQVFAIDYSGFGFSQGKATRKNVLRDGLNGIDYLTKIDNLKYDKLIIYGQSLGGHLSACVAEKRTDEIDGLVIEGAFSSHSDIAGDRVPVLGRIFTREMYSAEKAIQNFKKPVLIIHSTEDETIPYEHGEHLYELANETKELYTINKPHVRGPIYYMDSIEMKILEMIK